ncbi:phosphatidylglycerol lysyltransferase domain-containing protein [Streptomyces sp. NPDC058045]|uniref:phosphatidylglycerol lysyltransferase domain-containing protein n=1 Tax=Streptomyces sp. NPDC058045 TaxID=3346311 RepID=UPI0036ECE4D6
MSVRIDGEKSGRVARPSHPLRRVLRGPRPSAVPAFAARAGTLVGLLDIAAGVFPRFRHSRMHTLAEVLPGALGPFAAALSLSAGVLLLLLAHGLRRRKRRAWRAAVLLLPAGAVSQFAYRHSVLGVVISLALFTLLVRHRGEFAALPDPRSRWRALTNFLLTGSGSVLLGLLVVSAHPSRTVGDPGLYDRLAHVLYGLFGLEGPVDYTGNTSFTVAFSLGALGLLTALTTSYLALRPEHPAARLTEDDEARLRALLAKHGRRDSLGHFALRRDKGAVFSPSGKAAVCYRVVSGVMLASGDPIGDVEAWPGAIERFMDEATAHSWTPAVMGCSETGGEVWTRETGLDALEIGDEAIVDTAGFSLSGRAMRNVRQMVTRIERAGYQTRVRRVSELDEQELDCIRQASDDWRGTGTERGFSMALGRIGDPADGDCLIATAHRADPDEPGPHGDLKAVLHFVPWGEDGVSLDLMRRDRAADPGLNELLIVAALREAPGLGISRVSLNFAMFRAALARGEKIGAGPVLRAWRALLVFLSRWFQIESLYRFNAKFRPRWEPRFVVYRTSRDLPRIGLAALRAEGFVQLGLPAALRRRSPQPCPHHTPAADGAVPRGRTAPDDQRTGDSGQGSTLGV